MDYISEENLKIMFKALARGKVPFGFFSDVEHLDARLNLTGTDRSLANFILRDIGVSRKNLTEENLRAFMTKYEVL
jgi:hypothetical protein